LQSWQCIFSARIVKEKHGQSAVLHVPSVAKVELYGAQDGKINIKFLHKKFMRLGILFDEIIGQINMQNSVELIGVLVTSTDDLHEWALQSARRHGVRSSNRRYGAFGQLS
jgi:multidrug efflux pump subunit AcrB